MEFREGERLLLVHFGELWLKGRNRHTYISRLRRNILESVGGAAELFYCRDRFVLRPLQSDISNITESLRHVFGISNYGIAYAAKPTLRSIRKVAKNAMLEMEGPLRIEAHRSDKRSAFTSADITRSLCGVAEKAGIQLSLKAFASSMYVNLAYENAFVYTGRKKGSGGLPVGTSGKGVILLSGGIDSPLAAWYAMKRGISPIYVHLHAYSDMKAAGDEGRKIRDILNVLSRHSRHYKVYYVPSYIFEASSAGSNRYQLILLKSFMLSLAERIAVKEGASLIFTGESVGQVASQTAPNLLAEGYGMKMPVIRPLAGFDKEEIIKKAMEIDTYRYSILPYKDVCSINSKHPKTQAACSKITELRREMRIGSVVGRSLMKAEIVSA